MVCSRCKMAVKNVFEKNGFYTAGIALGEVSIDGTPPGKEQLQQIKYDLDQLGFEIIDDKKSKLIEHIKTLIVNIVHHNSQNPVVNFSSYISEKLHYDYNYLSNIFSETEGITIEKYFIAQKIEKIKELLMYNELNLTEIADRLGYSSVAYLSNQFKKETGLSPTFFKNLKHKTRRNIEDL